MFKKIIKALRYLEKNGLKSFTLKVIRKCFKINEPKSFSLVNIPDNVSIPEPNLTSINFYKVDYPYNINRVNLFIDEIDYQPSNIVLLLLGCILTSKTISYLRIITNKKFDTEKFYHLFHYITYKLNIVINFVNLSGNKFQDLDISVNDYFVTNDLGKIVFLSKFILLNRLILCDQNYTDDNKIRANNEILKPLVNDGLLYHKIDNLWENDSQNFDTIVNQIKGLRF